MNEAFVRDTRETRMIGLLRQAWVFSRQQNLSFRSSRDEAKQWEFNRVWIQKVETPRILPGHNAPIASE